MKIFRDEIDYTLQRMSPTHPICSDQIAESCYYCKLQLKYLQTSEIFAVSMLVELACWMTPKSRIDDG